MQHVVSNTSPPVVLADGMLEIHQLPAWRDNYIWLVLCRESGVAAVVDGPEAGPVLAWQEAYGIRVTTLLNTHTHADHVGINRDLSSRGLLDGVEIVGPRKVADDVPGITRPVVDGDVLQIGSAKVRVMQTEGHIDGHVSYVLDGAVFCGDTLFAGGCGYLFDGPPAKMADSLRRLAALPGDTLVCCAHEYTEDNLRFAWSVEPGNEALAERIRAVWARRAEGFGTVPSTIEEERATNPFLRTGSPTIRAALREAMPDASLDSHDAVFAATRALKDSKAYKAMDDSALPL